MNRQQLLRKQQALLRQQRAIAAQQQTLEKQLKAAPAPATPTPQRVGLNAVGILGRAAAQARGAIYRNRFKHTPETILATLPDNGTAVTAVLNAIDALKTNFPADPPTPAAPAVEVAPAAEAEVATQPAAASGQ